MSIEHAFGRLKQRFRILYWCRQRSVPKCVKIIHGCCVLHNLGDTEDFRSLKWPLPAVNPLEVRDTPQDIIDDSSGTMFRDELCNKFARASRKH